MTSPIELVTVACPVCHRGFETPFRGSFNLELDPWISRAYIEAMTTAVCPGCGTYFDIGPSLVVEGETWTLGP